MTASRAAAGSEEDVVFYCDGLQIAATVHVPAGREARGRYPAIVVCNGFGASKDLVVPDIARALCEDGYVVLRFDYRGFGRSAGQRNRLIPQEQVDDTRAALSYLSTLEYVDDTALGLYGTSFGGGHAVSVAGTDERVQCVVAVVPVGDGETWLRSLRRNWEWNEFHRRVEEDRRHRLLTGESEWVDSDEIMVPDPHSDKWHQIVIDQFPERKYSLPLETADKLLSYSPQAVVANISPRALLVIGVQHDDLVATSHTERLFAAAGEPKRKVILADLHHHDVYSGSAFDTVLRHASEWFGRHLRGREES